jgi:site-specific DNA-methyltransferase (adenine-specific)
MSDWLNRCHFGDCREQMLAWPAGVADACIADPPYGDTSLDWDKQVDGWIPAVARVLKPAASIWVFGSLRFLAPLFAEMHAAGFKYSQDIVWEKQNGSGLLNDRFRRVHEHAVMFYRGAWRDVYHDAQYTSDGTATTIRRTSKPIHMGGGVKPNTYTSVDGGPRLQRSVIRARNEHGQAVHPTQKPLGIVSPLISYSVPEGGVVVDPFFGSGTTGIAARILKRNFAGCEKDPAAMEMQRDRLRQSPLELEAA